MAAVRTSNQKRASTKIVIGFVIILAAIFGGSNLYSNYRISKMTFDPIAPGEVNIVGVDVGKGFRIIVANQIAQLVERDPGSDDQVNADHAQAEDSNKRRVPIREMLQSLQGNEEALGKFVMTINGLSENDLPAHRVIWDDSDIQKAFDGDPVLKKKLESDLNMNLDGSPMNEFRPSAMWDGIVLRAHVPVNVKVGKEMKKLIAPVLIPYKTGLMAGLDRELGQESNLTREKMAGHYAAAVQKLLETKKKEDLKEPIMSVIGTKHIEELAAGPERILGSATVVLNENQITKASYDSYDSPRGKMHNLNIELNSEGVDRMWSYSRGRVGSQLLVVANGIAIAAPKISHELSASSLQIDKLQDEVLVRDAVDMINKRKETK